MQDLFKRAFIAGHTSPAQRPSAEEWYNALTKLEGQLKKCSQVSHHEYLNSLLKCPWCEADQRYTQGINAAATTLKQSTIKNTMTPVTVRAPSASSVGSAYNYTPYAVAGATYVGRYGGGYAAKRAKKRKIILILSIVAIVALALSLGLSLGLSDKVGSSTGNLTTPTSLRVSNGQITWEGVKDAASYIVKVNEKEVPVLQNSFKLDSTYDAGTYTISVKAKGASDNNTESGYSKTITVVKPTTASNVNISDGIVYWDEVQGYNTYKILANGIIIDTIQSNSYVLKDNIGKINVGANGIAIAVAGDNASIVDSNSTREINITKLAAPLNVVVNEDTLSWQKVTGATGYAVKIEGGTEEITSNFASNINSYYLLGELPKGSYQIAVQALGNDNNTFSSELSLKYSYTLAETIITISSKADLLNIKNNLTAKYVLQNDIDISGEEWTPIGTISSRFEGVLVGKGYSIKGLSLTSKNTQGAGFFGVVGENGKVSDVKFTDVYISGGTTGYIGAVAGLNYGVIFDVTVSGSVGISNYGDNVGGLVGRNFGSFFNCVNKAAVNGNANVGGIAGNVEVDIINMQFNNCKNEGKIEGQTRIGGLAGYVRVERMVYIDGLTNSGTVNATGTYAGGICGYVEGYSGQTGNFTACVNRANIESADYAGGCFGYAGNYINIILNNPSDRSKECSNSGYVNATSGSNEGNIQGN